MEATVESIHKSIFGKETPVYDSTVHEIKLIYYLAGHEIHQKSIRATSDQWVRKSNSLDSTGSQMIKVPLGGDGERALKHAYKIYYGV